VALFAVGEVEQGNTGAANRIVLDRCDLGWNPILIALEVDDPILLLMAAATMADGDAALIVAAPLLAQRPEQRFLRPSAFGQLSEIAHARAAAACGDRVVLPNAHVTFS